jgi:hypothetical protein
VGIFLCRENPDATRIRPSQGDGGIDILVPVPGDPRSFAVYQVKCFNQNLSKGQKNQIERSFQRVQAFADANDFVITEWHLTLPLNPTKENREWLLALAQNATFPCDWRDLDYLDGLAAKYPDVVDYYLNDGKQRLESAIAALTEVLRLQPSIAGAAQPSTDPSSSAPLQPSEVVTALEALDITLNRSDPHFRYTYAVDHEPPIIPDTPYLVAAVQYYNDERCVTFKIFARFAEAMTERPVPGNFTIRAETGSDLARDVELFHHFGRPFEAPMGTVNAELDLPGGLGGIVESGRLIIGPGQTSAEPYELKLAILAPDDAVLAEPLIKLQPATTGPSGRGVRGYGVEEHGTFTLELRHLLGDRNLEFHFSLADLTGIRPALVLEGLRFLVHHRPPNRMRVRPAYGPPKGSEPIPIQAPIDNIRFGLVLLEFAEALVTIQEHTTMRVEMPKLSQLTDRQMFKAIEAARLLRGENVTHAWDGATFHLHPSAEMIIDVATPFPARVVEPLVVDLPGRQIVLGNQTVALPAARVDRDSGVRHEDHMDIRLIPAGDTPAVITYMGDSSATQD